MLALRTPLFDSLVAPLENALEGYAVEAAPAWGWHRFSPAADIRATEAGYLIELDVPGLTEKEVEVTVENKHLTLKGERKAVEGEYSRRERAFGSFERVFHLPDDADVGAIAARCRNGVLTVTIPKAESAKPKTIAVKAE